MKIIHILFDKLNQKDCVMILGNSFANNFQNIYYPAGYVLFHIYMTLYMYIRIINPLS